ncbi:MAG: hypothetical protein LBK08_04700 [Treponema sp.]|jgi:hypothetical protein|nr:hypothetical protein [Treponema sp.]
MKKAARSAVYVKKIPEFVSHTAVVGTVFARSLSHNTHRHFPKKICPGLWGALKE